MFRNSTKAIAATLLTTGLLVGTGLSASAAPVVRTTTCSAASAQDPSTPTGNNAVAANISGGLLGYTACVGPLAKDTYGPNDVLGDGNPLLSHLDELFPGSTNWSFIGKVNNGGPASNGFNWTTAGNGYGSWSYAPGFNAGDSFALSLKTATSFSVYYFQDIAEAVTSGLWSTIGVDLDGSGNAGKDLSHAALFRIAGTPTTPPTKTPEPATFLGLGFLALVGSRSLKKGAQ